MCTLTNSLCENCTYDGMRIYCSSLKHHVWNIFSELQCDIFHWICDNNNSHLGVAYHWQWNHSTVTRCDNNRICQVKVKARQGSAEQISFQTSSLMSPASLCALPERDPSTQEFSTQCPHEVSGWKGAVVCPGQDSVQMTENFGVCCDTHLHPVYF